jgi:hypothetical protein
MLTSLGRAPQQTSGVFVVTPKCTFGNYKHGTTSPAGLQRFFVTPLLVKIQSALWGDKKPLEACWGGCPMLVISESAFWGYNKNARGLLGSSS